MNILKQVFNINDGKYRKENSYWKSYNINKLIDNLNDLNKKRLIDSYNEIKKKYINLSKEYQLTKEKNFIPLK